MNVSSLINMTFIARNYNYMYVFEFNMVLNKSLFGAVGMFSSLLLTADTFLQKYNLRRLKFGTIIEFLDKFNMTSSKEALRGVVSSVKVIVSDESLIQRLEQT